MDFFYHSRNPNIYSSSVVPIASNKSSTTFHGSREGEKKKNERNNKISSKVKLSKDPQSVAARERRHRISERFKILRSLIPGDTKNMDTVSMLEEAIQYVKYLKSQIWLHQTMISFDDNHYDNFSKYNYHYPHHQDYLLPLDHIHHHISSLPQIEHEMLAPQVGFAQGSCVKVEGEENMVSLSHDHHLHVIYP